MPTFVSIDEPHIINSFQALKSNEQTQQDLTRLLDRIYFEAELRKKYLLQQALPGWSFATSVYLNGAISYVAEDYTHWESCPTFFADGTFGRYEKKAVHLLAGEWKNSWTGAHGRNLVGLLANILGAKDTDTIKWIARMLGIDLKVRKAHQFELPTDFDFVSNPQIAGAPEPPVHWLLGPPYRQYCFFTEFGVPSFFLNEWMVLGECLRLFYTFCRTGSTDKFNWFFVRPPVEEILFNKHRLFYERSLPVRIYDDIALAGEHASQPHFVATWSGEVDFTANIDWSLLAGREVSYASSLVTQDSFIIGETLHNILRGIQTDLTFEKNR